MSEWDVFLRLGLASLTGLVLGVDREMRGISAGIRTHALVGLSSAVITISALQLYDVLVAGGQPNTDPLRVIQGLAQAIGFVAAGAIFVSRGDVHNLTSAANIWLAAALGIASGAGQYELVGIGALFGVVILTVVRLMERWLPGSDKAERD